jgi:hypothetical protein
MYVFCENETKTVLTPTRLVKKLIVQLLLPDLHPDLAYRGPKFFFMDRDSKERSRSIRFEVYLRNLLWEFLAYSLLLIEWRNARPMNMRTWRMTFFYLFWMLGNVRIFVTRIYGPLAEVQDNPFLQDVYIDTFEYSHGDTAR